jgi:hypothetical protein
LFGNIPRGTLPEELKVLDEMGYFEFSSPYGNRLTGTIPSSIGTAWTKLTAFIANENSLSGSFPFTSPLLGTILLNNNNVEDDVNTLFSHINLSRLEANNNKFTGTLPKSMTELQYLSKTNTIYHLCQMPNIKYSNSVIAVSI